MTSESRTLNRRSIVFSEKFRRPHPLPSLLHLLSLSLCPSPPLFLSIYLFHPLCFYHDWLVIANYFNSQSSITLVLVSASSASVASEGKRGTSGTRSMPRDIKWRKEVFERGVGRKKESREWEFLVLVFHKDAFPFFPSLFLSLSVSFCFLPPFPLPLPVYLPATHSSILPASASLCCTIDSARNYVYVPWMR